MEYKKSDGEYRECTNSNGQCMEHKPIAMAYVPFQIMKDVYDLNDAICYGTIFPELNKPFTGKGGMYR